MMHAGSAHETCLSAVPPVQKYCMGHVVPAGPDEPGGQKFPGGAVQGFGCAEPPSQYCPYAQANRHSNQGLLFAASDVGYQDYIAGLRYPVVAACDLT